MKINFILLILVILIVACDQGQTKKSKHNTHKVDSSHTDHGLSKKLDDHLSVKQTLDLLQGKWQHIDDRSNYLVFDGNLRKETADGMTGWDIEEFTLSNKCLNESDRDNGIEKEEAKYMSCIKSDLCWHIIGVDNKNLMLSYMGRGNTLTYRRVK